MEEEAPRQSASSASGAALDPQRVSGDRAAEQRLSDEGASPPIEQRGSEEEAAQSPPVQQRVSIVAPERKLSRGAGALARTRTRGLSADGERGAWSVDPFAVELPLSSGCLSSVSTLVSVFAEAPCRGG